MNLKNLAAVTSAVAALNGPALASEKVEPSAVVKPEAEISQPDASSESELPLEEPNPVVGFFADSSAVNRGKTVGLNMVGGLRLWVNDRISFETGIGVRIAKEGSHEVPLRGVFAIDGEGKLEIETGANVLIDKYNADPGYPADSLIPEESVRTYARFQWVNGVRYNFLNVRPDASYGISTRARFGIRLAVATDIASSDNEAPRNASPANVILGASGALAF